MELRKISKIMSMVCFLFYFTGCQNDFTEVMDSNAPMEQQVKDQKLQYFYEKYKNTPIQSLFNTTRATQEVLNGECVIGAIQYCGSHFNNNISKDEIVTYFGDKVQKDSKGNIIGIALNSSDWDDAWNHWFTAIYPNGQWDLINKVNAGNIACCRLGSSRTHAIVLIGVDENSDAFIYYDPVLGGENHKASFTEIYDPRIITEK